MCKAAAAGVAAAKPPSIFVAAVTLAPNVGAAGNGGKQRTAAFP